MKVRNILESDREITKLINSEKESHSFILREVKITVIKKLYFINSDVTSVFIKSGRRQRNRNFPVLDGIINW